MVENSDGGTPTLDQLLKDASKRESAGDLDGALELLTEAISIAPGSSRALRQRGTLLLLRAEFDKARQNLAEAVRIDATDAVARENLVNALYNLRLYDQAMDVYRAAIQLEPDNASYHAALGHLLYDRGDRAAGEHEFREALRLDVGCASAHAGLGMCFSDRRSYRMAAEELQEAIRPDPRNTFAHSWLGNVYFTVGRLADAEREHREALRLEPACYELTAGLGRTVVRRAKHDRSLLSEAERIYQEALRIRPDGAEALSGMADVQFALGKKQHALELVRRATRSDPQFLTGWAVLAKLSFLTGRWRETFDALHTHWIVIHGQMMRFGVEPFREAPLANAYVKYAEWRTGASKRRSGRSRNADSKPEQQT